MRYTTMRYHTKQDEKMMLAVSIIVSLLIGALTAYFAVQRGRDMGIWFFLGIIFGVFGLLALFLLPDLSGKKEEEQQKEAAPADVVVIPAVPTIQEVWQNSQWFYIGKERVQQGPVAFSRLKELWKDGAIDAEAFVWYDGLGLWKRIREVVDLEEELKKIVTG